MEIEIEHGDWRIYIEANPDCWRGGFVWSICRDDTEWDSGLAFAAEGAETAARQAEPGESHMLANERQGLSNWLLYKDIFWQAGH
jgi:hypothetical protein